MLKSFQTHVKMLLNHKGLLPKSMYISLQYLYSSPLMGILLHASILNPLFNKWFKLNIVKPILRREAILYGGSRFNAAKEIAFFLISTNTQLPQTIVRSNVVTKSILLYLDDLQNAHARNADHPDPLQRHLSILSSLTEHTYSSSILTI